MNVKTNINLQIDLLIAETKMSSHIYFNGSWNDTEITKAIILPKIRV